MADSLKTTTDETKVGMIVVNPDGSNVGGTQYTEGDTDTTITGTAVMWEGMGNVLRTASRATPLPVEASFTPGSVDSFGHFVTGSINNQVDIQFYRGDGSVGDLVTETNANGGTATATGGMATFSATTTANSSSKGVTNTTTIYTAGAELYTLFTAGWTGTGAGTSYQRIGLYNDNNGFFIGKTANSFGITIRKAASDTTTAQASFSEDVLTGASTSKFTRNGTPEAVDLTKLNVWRIRFGWVGSAPISFEVLSPDGMWVTFHKILQPNLTSLPSVEDADLPVTCHVNSGNSGAELTIITNCWAAGTTQALSRMDATITNATIAQLGRSVITGETSAGGGGYVNVKVNPSGSLETNVSGTVTANLSATDNQVLDDISADTGNIDTKLGAIDTDTGNIATSVATIAAAVSTEMQVDVVGALPAGTNAIGKLAANSGVDIGDVDVTSLPALATGTNYIGKISPPDVDVTTHTNYAKKFYTGSAPTDGIVWSPAAGKRWHVVSMIINVSADATVTLEDDLTAGDSVLWSGDIAGKSGFPLTFSENYPLVSGEDAADLIITASAGTVTVTCVGYEI